MDLYTCGQKTKHAWMGHPCAKAGNALTAAGHSYNLKTVKGYKNVPFMYKPLDRAEIHKLSGQDLVPILVLDGGEVISGSGKIAAWAKANPAA